MFLIYPPVLNDELSFIIKSSHFSSHTALLMNIISHVNSSHITVLWIILSSYLILLIISFYKQTNIQHN